MANDGEELVPGPRAGANLYGSMAGQSINRLRVLRIRTLSRSTAADLEPSFL